MAREPDILERIEPWSEPQPATIPLEIPTEEPLKDPLKGSIDYLLSLQRSDGYWWFALEANEGVGAGFIFVMNYLGCVDQEIQRGICNRIKDVQGSDGSWSVYKDGPGDLSTTIECYLALKIGGQDANAPMMQRAREFILNAGGIEKTRVFTKIHLAMFGLVPWETCPVMPPELIFLPSWFPINIYEFSSWARCTIVPLIIFMSVRKSRSLPEWAKIDELFCQPPAKRDYSYRTEKKLISWERFFIYLNNCLRVYERLPFKPLRKLAIRRCAEWIWRHIQKSEDIYPALAYGTLAFSAMGYPNDSPQIRKPFTALKMFNQRYTTLSLPALPDEIRDDGQTRPSQLRELGIDPRVSSEQPLTASVDDTRIHQQCCISPVWDTPWAMTALLESGVAPSHPALLKAGTWLLSKEITETRGDWAVKNPHAQPGGWAFEFENEFFPDVDDTIQVLTVLRSLKIPEREKSEAIRRGLAWLVSMQNADGGWGAFDQNQTCNIVNHIPFADHDACLDPSSPDITGRMVELLAVTGFSSDSPVVARAMDYIWKTQETFGGWYGRWGVNYLYGTWCVLTGLAAIGWDMGDERIGRATSWLMSVQHPEGGFGESPESYVRREFVPLNANVPSQTAWALMGLVAGGAASSEAARQAARFLLKNRNPLGSWDEEQYTGTGFPGHFYLRYHGYRHFFPLLALARYRNQIQRPAAGGT